MRRIRRRADVGKLASFGLWSLDLIFFSVGDPAVVAEMATLTFAAVELSLALG